MIVDKIAVTYDSFDELLRRRVVIENTASSYLERNPIASRIESVVRVTEDNKFVLEVNLIED